MILLRFLLLVLIVSACKSGEIACPEPKLAKLRKRPANYQMRMQSRSYSASAKEEKERPEINFRQTRPVKSAANIEEWDCPKPGQKTTMPKAVKDNIRKNRKKFENYYRSRNESDSTSMPTVNIPK